MKDLIFTLCLVLVCHCAGDYWLQIDFISQSKGKNWWHLIVHCVLYCAIFWAAFGFNWRLLPLFATHIIVDALKARYKAISYTQDQIAHLIIAAVLYLIP